MLCYVTCMFCSVKLCYVMLCWHGINEYDSVIAKIICRQLQDHKRKKEIAKIWLICGLKRSPAMS